MFIIENRIKSSIFSIKDNAQYLHLDQQKYKNFFYELKSKNILSGNYNESVWQVNDTLIGYSRPFNFDIEIYQELNEALKAYVIINLFNSVATVSIYNQFIHIKRLILKTAGLSDLKKLESYFEELRINYKNEAYVQSSTLKKFLNFYPIKNYMDILKICSNYPKPLERRQRDLPNFEDVLTFDHIVNDYFQNNHLIETLKFLPIMVWWTITNVIPLRPSEFLLIKIDCIFQEKNYNKTKKIIVPRTKGRSKEIIEEPVEIDESAYRFLQKTILLIKEIEPDSQYLFPVKLLKMFSKTNSTPKKNTRINIRDFGYLKELFYTEVIIKQYGHKELEMIKTGDTRHFAIINMALQGFNMHSIAQMAGHAEIKSQETYYSHAEHFAQSYVYKLAQLKFEKNVNFRFKNGLTGWKRYMYEKGKLLSAKINDDNIVGKVKYGYCKELKINFPNSCIRHCKYCNKYIFAPVLNEQQEALLWLSDSSKELEKKLENVLSFYKTYRKHLPHNSKQLITIYLKQLQKK